MVYITYPRPPRYRQITFEDILLGKVGNDLSVLKVGTPAETRTVKCKDTPKRFKDNFDQYDAIARLREFNDRHSNLLGAEDKQKELYHQFYIPKSSGGLREINAPNPELKIALNELKNIFEQFILTDHHTAAFAYVKGRSTIDAVKQHQKWESKWFLKIDLHGFFPSTTINFIMNMFSVIYPFNLICETRSGREALRTALSLCMLNGGLPQGSPISPMITNIMMIPMDFAITNGLHHLQISENRKERFVFTRYADDMTISCRVDFDYKKVVDYIVSVLNEFHSPFELNHKKTIYGSNAGQNWILGVKLNKDNNISVGYKEKKAFEAMVNNYLVCHKPENIKKNNGIGWNLHDVQKLRGLYNYYHMVEPDRIDYIVGSYSQKYGMNFLDTLSVDEKNLLCPATQWNPFED